MFHGHDPGVSFHGHDQIVSFHVHDQKTAQKKAKR